MFTHIVCVDSFRELGAFRLPKAVIGLLPLCFDMIELVKKEPGDLDLPLVNTFPKSNMGVELLISYR